MDIKNIYEQLTSVDIKKQQQIWDERGKGYYGEYLLFCELYKCVPGNCKILMNLNIPVDDAKTTEVDLVLIHETGLYVFEIKHYKGTIYGKDTDAVWTQYFRTAKNNTFKNPIEQNAYHISALKKQLPNVPMHSCIVFTNDECNLRIEKSDKSIEICQLKTISKVIESLFSKNENRFSINDIEYYFLKLCDFSQMKEPITLNDKEADFQTWVQPIISELESKKLEVEAEKKNLIANTEKLKLAKKKGILGNILVAFLCIVLSIVVCYNTIQKNNRELSKFKQNFLHIDEIGNPYIDALNSYVKISNLSLLPLSDDAVTFTARISMSNDTYGVELTKDSKYIVMTNAGKVMEYNVFGKHLPYYRINNMIGSGIRPYGDLAKVQFYGISNINDITYIKITGINLFKLDARRTVIKNELELELYSKQ